MGQPVVPAPPKPRSWAARHKILSSLIAVVAVGTVASAVGGGTHGTKNASSSTPSTPSAGTSAAGAAAPVDSSAPAQQPAAPAPAAPVNTRLLSLSGDGANNTAPFTTTGDWAIAYTFHCSDGQGNFAIDVGGDGDAAGDVAANQLASSGRDVSHEYGAGTYYLEVNSECRWHVTVTGPAGATPAKPGGAVLLSKSGSGIGNTAEFTANGPWALSYTFDCASQGGQGNFAVDVAGNGDGDGDTLANELASSGSAVSYDYNGGTYHLEVNSECAWHITVRG